MRFSQLSFEEYSVIQWLNPDLSQDPEIRENLEVQDLTGSALGTSFPAKREEIPKE